MKNTKSDNINQKLINHLKNTGFIFPGSDIYGGVKNTWDYGPLGLLYKRKISALWEKRFIDDTNSVLIDANTFLHPQTWNASGHDKRFFDVMVDCKKCKKRYKYDLNEKIEEKCANCSSTDMTEPRNFNLMLKTALGIVKNNMMEISLRPELAQGIFLNFKNVMKFSRKKIPFGIGQIGLSYRNEITPGHFLFKTREFTQMELEYFIYPNQEDENKCFNFFDEKIQLFLFEDLKIKNKNIKIIDVKKNELAHYSSQTLDYMYNFSFGFNEIWGLAKRKDFDLKQHMQYSKEKLYYFDNVLNENIVPYVVESSVGLDRLFYASLNEYFCIEELDNSNRIVLKIPNNLAPYIVAVLPLSNIHNHRAYEIFQNLKKQISNMYYDDSGNIGKKYRRQDAIGTPYCITIDNDSIKSMGTVTLRFRDSMKQIKLNIENLYKELSNYL